ncbi:MAG: GspH/FimT family pseudopilin [Salinisphaera sp.]|nr:GspH/FimT family pseudopilin [Salinisphaera sp.]
MPNQAGFTLLELLVAIAISTILLVLGVPSFLHMMAENQRDSYTANFYAALTQARSEAITRNVPVVLCKSSDGALCTASGDYSAGWLVYANLDGSVSGAEPDAADTLLDSHQRLGGDFTLTSSDLPVRVIYQPSGRAAVDGAFQLCPATTKISGSSIEITSTGRPRIGTGQCS